MKSYHLILIVTLLIVAGLAFYQWWNTPRFQSGLPQGFQIHGTGTVN